MRLETTMRIQFSISHLGILHVMKDGCCMIIFYVLVCTCESTQSQKTKIFHKHFFVFLFPLSGTHVYCTSDKSVSYRILTSTTRSAYDCLPLALSKQNYEYLQMMVFLQFLFLSRGVGQQQFCIVFLVLLVWAYVWRSVY